MCLCVAEMMVGWKVDGGTGLPEFDTFRFITDDVSERSFVPVLFYIPLLVPSLLHDSFRLRNIMGVCA